MGSMAPGWGEWTPDDVAAEIGDYVTARTLRPKPGFDPDPDPDLEPPRVIEGYLFAVWVDQFKSWNWTVDGHCVDASTVAAVAPPGP